MSIILKALRSKKNKGESNTNAAPANGIAWANPKLKNSRRTYGLKIFLLVIIFGLIGVLYNFHPNIQEIIETNIALKKSVPVPIKALSPEEATRKRLERTFKQYTQNADYHYQIGEFEKSEQFFKKALEINSSDTYLLNGLGLSQLKQKNFSESENSFFKAISVNKNCKECYNNLGYLKSLQNKPKEAEKFLKQAITIDEGYAEPYFNLAVLYESFGDKSFAKKSYEKFLQRTKEKESPLFMRVKNHSVALGEN